MFKMLTLNLLASQIMSEDWFVTIVLKDAYFHRGILPKHRKFLWFAFMGKVLPILCSTFWSSPMVTYI